MAKDLLSFSSLSTYAACPASYNAKYNQKQYTVKSEALRYGKMLHEVIKTINLKVMEDKENLDMTEVKELYTNTFKKENFVYTRFAKGLEIILQYAEDAFRSRNEIFKVEYKLLTNLKVCDKNIGLQGIIDRIDICPDGIEIYDFKSGAFIPSREEINDDLQLSIYAYLISKQFPEMGNIYTSYYSLGTQRKIKVLKDIKKLDYLEEYLIALSHKLIADEKYEATLNEFCYWCPIKTDCKLYNKFLAENYQAVEISEPKTAVIKYLEYGQNINMLKKEKDKLSGLLKNLIDENLGEPLETEDYIVTVRHKSRAEYVSPATEYSQLTFAKKQVESEFGKALKQLPEVKEKKVKNKGVKR